MHLYDVRKLLRPCLYAKSDTKTYGEVELRKGLCNLKRWYGQSPESECWTSLPTRKHRFYTKLLTRPKKGSRQNLESLYPPPGNELNLYGMVTIRAVVQYGRCLRFQHRCTDVDEHGPRPSTVLRWRSHKLRMAIPSSFLSCQTMADRPLLTFERHCFNNQVQVWDGWFASLHQRFARKGRKDGHGPQATFYASSEWRRSGGYRLCVCLWWYFKIFSLLASTESKLHMSNLMFGCQTHWGLNAKFWIWFMLCPLSECR